MLLSISTAAAQTSIPCGQTLTGSISTNGENDYYTLTAAPGDKVTIRLIRTAGTMAPDFELYDTSGTRVGYSNNWTGSNTASLNTTLSLGGTYTLIVSAYGNAATGSYNLTWQKLNAPCNTTPLPCGQTTASAISAGAEQDHYTLTAAPGDKVTIRLIRTAGTMAPDFELYDTSGTRVGYSNNWTGSNTASLDTTLSLGGTYTLIVSAYGNAATGSYNLTWQKLNAPCNTTPLPCGQTTAGAISAGAEQDHYTLTAAPGDKVTIRLIRTAGTMAPDFELYDTSGTRVGYSNNWTGSNTASLDTTLSLGGTYTLIVSAYGNAATGSYNLTWQKLNAPCNTTPLPCGQTTAGAISAGAEQDHYTLTAAPGDKVTIRLIRTAGTMAPDFELYDTSGTRVGYSNNWTGSNTASLDTTLSLGGTYTLIVSAYGNAATGSYNLIWQNLSSACNNGTATTLTLNNNPSTYGQGVTFTANVTPNTATGTIQFQVDGTNRGAPVALANGSATSALISDLSIGAHSIKAVYSGDLNFAGSSSGTLIQTVNQACNGSGKIVLVNDDWVLSDTGFSAPNDPGRFAANVASWFTGGQPGKFHAYSDHFGLTGSSLASAMTGAGHTWTTGNAGFTFDLPTLKNYDGIFLLVAPADNNVLINYVESGGNVYLAYSGDASHLDEQYNSFVNHFGLGLGTINNGISGNVAISSTHPIFSGVDSLYNVNGSDIVDLAPADARQAVLISQNEHGLYAVYHGGGLPNAATNAATNVTANAATLNGTVNPIGAETTYYFEWGSTTAYGKSTTPQSAGSGVGDVVVSANLSGLTANATYHYRLVVANNCGTTYGSDKTLVTLSGILFSEDFESYAPGGFPVSGGWQLIYAGRDSSYQYVDNSRAVSGSKSLHLVGSSCWSADAFHAVTIPPLVKLEANVLVDQIVSCGCTPILGSLGLNDPTLGTWGTGFGSISFNCDGNMYAQQKRDQSSTILLMPYTAQKWYHLEVYLDLTKRTFSVYVDGVHYGSTQNILDTGLPTGVKVQAGHGNYPAVWFDDVKVSVWSGSTDTTPPSPNPMTWQTQPIATGSTALTLSATTATDADSPPVQYFFNFTDSPTGGAGGADSGWQSGTGYTNSGLQPNHRYGYRVKARDSASLPNETAYSTTLYQYTQANAPTAAAFSNIAQTSLRANWTANSNRDGTEYYCENTSKGTNSGWMTSLNWNETGLACNTVYTYRVKARNGESTETVWTSLGLQSTAACGLTPAIRTLPTYYTPGVALTVTIAVTPASGTKNYAVEDTPPAGWTVSNISNGGTWVAAEGKVKWGHFFDNTARTLTFKATPPPGETGAKIFSGIASFDGQDIPIAGDYSISMGLWHQADTGDDYRIGIDEVTAYGAAWKKGQSWPSPPNPIPIAYLTNAGFIWKTAEVYHYDPTRTPPWVPGSLGAALFVQNLGISLSTRNLPNSYVPLVPQEVTIAVTPDAGVANYAVEEIPPDGWVVSDINEGGAWDAGNKKIKWGVFMDNTPRTLTYKATPPAGESGSKTFMGTASFDGANQTISGETSISNGAVSHIFLPLIIKP